jgi:hypothetical protein
MSYQRRLSDRLIEGFQSACEAHNEILATVLREAANVELAGVHRRDYIDRRPNSSAFRRALAQHAHVFHA